MTPPRATVTWPDLFALLREGLARTADEPFDDWVAREGFDPHALANCINFMVDNWAKADQPVEALVLYAFTAGWDAHRDLRGERE